MKRLVAFGGCHLFETQVPGFVYLLNRENSFYSVNKIDCRIGTVEDTRSHDFQKLFNYLENNREDLQLNTILLFQFGNSFFANSIRRYIPPFISKKIKPLETSGAEGLPISSSSLLLSNTRNILKYIVLPANIIWSTLTAFKHLCKLNTILKGYASNHEMIIILSPFYCKKFPDRLLRRYGVFLFGLIFRGRYIQRVNCYKALNNPSFLKDEFHLNESGHRKLFDEIQQQIAIFYKSFFEYSVLVKC